MNRESIPLYPVELADEYKKCAGEQWQPSNGTEGDLFQQDWCCKCARDKVMSEGKDFEDCTEDDLCDILAASYRGEAKEWQYDKEGQPCCTAFVFAGDKIPTRDDLTIDMFKVDS